jgi:hypothetical protein
MTPRWRCLSRVPKWWVNAQRLNTFEHFAICSGLRLPLTLGDGDGS